MLQKPSDLALHSFIHSFFFSGFMLCVPEDFRLSIGLATADEVFISRMSNRQSHAALAGLKSWRMLAQHLQFAGTHKWVPSRQLLPPDHPYRQNRPPFTTVETTPQVSSDNANKILQNAHSFFILLPA
jgi:hypothetical protein